VQFEHCALNQILADLAIVIDKFGTGTLEAILPPGAALAVHKSQSQVVDVVKSKAKK